MQTMKPSDAPGERAFCSGNDHKPMANGGTYMNLQRKRILPSIRSIAANGRVWLLLFTLAALARPVAAQEYQLFFLDDLGGNSRGNSINNGGWIAGFSLLTIPRRHAALWRDGSILDLGTLGTPDKNSNVPWPVKNS